MNSKSTRSSISTQSSLVEQRGKKFALSQAPLPYVRHTRVIISSHKLTHEASTLALVFFIVVAVEIDIDLKYCLLRFFTFNDFP